MSIYLTYNFQLAAVHFKCRQNKYVEINLHALIQGNFSLSNNTAVISSNRIVHNAKTTNILSHYRTFFFIYLLLGFDGITVFLVLGFKGSNAINK